MFRVHCKANFLNTRKNFPDAQKLSGWQCILAYQVFGTLQVSKIQGSKNQGARVRTTDKKYDTEIDLTIFIMHYAQGFITQELKFPSLIKLFRHINKSSSHLSTG